MPNGGRINMGFEGNTAEASLSSGTWAPPPLLSSPESSALMLLTPILQSTTALSYQLPVNSYVEFQVFDTAGRLVTELVKGWRDAALIRSHLTARHCRPYLLRQADGGRLQRRTENALMK